MRIAIAGLALAWIFTGTASAHFQQAKLTIRHQMRGCHSWSFNGGPYKPSLKITVEPGTTLTVIDNDVMPHELVQLAGPKAKLFAPSMRHMSALAKVVLSRKGTYKFTTRAGEDYPNMSNMKTVGQDYALRLTVVVR
jgi:plastocyanin